MNAPQLPILYCDDQLVAVHKPPGLLVHRTYLERNEKYFALQLLRDQLGERVYPAHRLDRPTSGVLLFARSREIAREIGGLFQGGAVEKVYLALVRGWPDSQGEIDWPLSDLDAAQNGATPPRAAITHYTLLKRFELPYPVGRYATSRYALLELRPRQGRRHQLRRHMKHMFHPIVGDVNYGDGKHNRFFREQYACRRLMLVAQRLSFVHPRSGQRLTIAARAEGSFSDVLSRLAVFEPGDA